MRQETKKLLQALVFHLEMLIFSKQQRRHLDVNCCRYAH